jgi:CBS domain-containing protein
MMNEFDLPVARHLLKPVHSIRSDVRLTAAAEAMRALGISALPVVDSGSRLVGVLDRADLIRAGRLRSRGEGGPQWWWPDLQVSECMQTAVQVVSPEQPLRACARRMFERGLTRLYVVADRELEGVVGTRELMATVLQAQVTTPLAEMVNQHAEGLSSTALLSEASARLLAEPGRPLVIVEQQTPIGVFSRTELQACLEADPTDSVSLWMDKAVLMLPADTPASAAAERALESGARYLISNPAPLSYQIVGGLSFAATVAGGMSADRAVPPEPPRAAVSIATPVYGSEVEVPAAPGLPGEASAPAALERPKPAAKVQSAPEPRSGERREPPEPR